MCENPQIVHMKIPAFGGEFQVHYQVPCCCCESCLKDKKKFFSKFDKKRYNDLIKEHFKRKEVKR